MNPQILRVTFRVLDKRFRREIADDLKIAGDTNESLSEGIRNIGQLQFLRKLLGVPCED